MFGVMVIFSIAIIGRIIFLQTIRGDKWRSKADQRYVRERQIPARRGNIYADDGSLLATSITKYRLTLDPRVSQKYANNEILYRDSVGYFCKELPSILKEGHDSTYYRQMIKKAVLNKELYLSLTNKILDYDDKMAISELPWANKGKYKSGIMFDTLNIRYNPFGNLARRTIGFKKEKEKAGLEFSFDPQLGGIPGQGVFEKIAGGSWRPVDDTEEAYPTPGLDLYTSLNVSIQDVAETALRKKLIEFRADKGCVVVMEVATGEIKAMTNMSKQRNGSYQEDYNHAVRGSTDPGSTFKLASMLALLEEGLDPKERVETGNGRFVVYGVPVVDTKSHGNISAQEVMEQSSNVGVAKLMWKYFEGKKEDYYNYLRKYHLLDPLNFQIRSPEDIPKIRDISQWDRVAMYSISRGYESGITPLQILAFYNAVANGGRWVQPIIVKQSRDADEIKEDFTVSQLKVKEPFCKEEYIKKAQKMLEGVVENGTAMILKNIDYQIAGKTGTAQRYVKGRGYIKDSLLYTSFVGYFPANEPKYSCIVMIDNPHTNSGFSCI